MSLRQGRFISFEGLDGCGKSTQIEKLANVLRAQGTSIVATREPGGTSAGDKIRQPPLDTSRSGLSSIAELALMLACRPQQPEQVIHASLYDGRLVLCDR